MHRILYIAATFQIIIIHILSFFLFCQFFFLISSYYFLEILKLSKGPKNAVNLRSKTETMIRQIITGKSTKLKKLNQSDW